MIKAEIIADSKNEYGQRLTTFVLTFPRIVLAEFNTHRMLSKNSASSRAIPFKKMVEMVETNPFIPIRWMKDHKGMQGTEYFTEQKEIDDLIKDWLTARDIARLQAYKLSDSGLTKQICNRLLEPFMWHTVIVTGSEWENFFALRAHEAAEIHIQDLAYKMLEAYNNSTPKQLYAGDWHVPFGDKFDTKKILNLRPIDDILVWGDMALTQWTQVQVVKIATARCARVSYLNFEGKDDYEADIKLHDMLLSSGHMSPFEHCAKAMSDEEFELWTNGKLHIDGIYPGRVLHNDGYTEGWCGNFRGFIQYRKMLNGENKIDNRVNK